MATLRGIEQLKRNMIQITRLASQKTGKTLDEIGKQAVKDIRARLGQPFQAVPTYIYETERLGLHGGPGKYPPGTVGVYAKRASSIRGTRLEQVAQLYKPDPKSKRTSVQHRLRDELIYKVIPDASGRAFRLFVGYPESSLAGRDKQAYIRHVLLGTRLMQSRNFLLEFFRNARSPVFRALRAAGVVIIRNKGD